MTKRGRGIQTVRGIIDFEILVGIVVVENFKDVAT